MANATSKTYPQAPGRLFTTSGTYQAEAPADELVYSLDLDAIQLGDNRMNIYFVAAGDMNASYIPGGQLRQQASLVYEGKLIVPPTHEIEIPVFVSNEMEIGAMTLGLSYNPELMRVIEVTGSDVYHVDPQQGTIKAVWMDVRGKTLTPTTPVITIKAEVLAADDRHPITIELLPETEFGNLAARPIADVVLKTPTLVQDIATTGELEIIHKAWPNPFKSNTVLSYLLPESGKTTVKIFNQYGQLVQQESPMVKTAGSYRLDIFSTELHNSGTFYYEIILEGSLKTYRANGKLDLIR
jgi:hypothetical protein